MTTRLDLIKSAQVRIGDRPLASEVAPGADVYLAIYDRVRDDLQSRYSWSWNTVTRRLTRLSAVPDVHWAYFYQLPSDMIGAPRAVYSNAEYRIPFHGYEITENRLATAAEEIYVRFSKRAEISIWPGYFIELFETVLRSEFAMSVREDSTLYARLREVAFGSEALMGQGGLFHQATSMDLQSQPSRVIAEGYNPLIAARY